MIIGFVFEGELNNDNVAVKRTVKCGEYMSREL
jgi:hypothetical protein